MQFFTSLKPLFIAIYYKSRLNPNTIHVLHDTVSGGKKKKKKDLADNLYLFDGYDTALQDPSDSIYASITVSGVEVDFGFLNAYEAVSMFTG